MELFTPSGAIKRNLPQEDKTRACIIQFREVHGARYDYSKVIYSKSNEKVIIICKKHGEFLQIPANHKRGRGCPKCNPIGGNKRPLTTEQAIQGFKEVHGDLYDYSKVDYHRSSQKVTIVCKLHGEFSQTPSAHKSGKGCPTCIGKQDTLYFVHLFNNTYKIGITRKSLLDIRLANLGNSHGVQVNPLITLTLGDSVKQLERSILAELSRYRTTEITSGDGHTEMFDLTLEQRDNLIAFLDKIRYNIYIN